LGVVLAACQAPATSRPDNATRGETALPADWRRGATCYEVFVRSFADSDGDGIGDLRGLTSRLDYINDGDPGTLTDLGARCIWLMPIVESPTYHGYDATDYYRVDPDYGTNADFRRFVTEAHRRGIAVFTDMVLNHLSSEHPYFQSALGGPDAPYRDWFRWASPKPAEAGPWGQNAWHRSPRRDEYYYGVFWHTMPDLDYATPAVRDEAKKIATFWLTEMGVDGFRLDAVPYLVEEGNRLIGTAGTHAFLREYAAHVRSVAPKAFTVGEVWDGLERMLPYYPDQLETYFAFDLSDALLDAVRTGSGRELLALFMRFQESVPDGRWATFLRNHDQTRTVTALGGRSPDSMALAIARAKMSATLLLTLPGLPFIYYGEEIGMTGDKPDERIRTPMQWTSSPGAGFTTGTPWQSLQSDWRTTNVAAQEGDSTSLLALYRRLIRLRRTRDALGAGGLAPLTTSHGAVSAYVRRSAGQSVLVVANLGNASVANVALAATDSTLPPGRYSARALDAEPDGAELVVGPRGRLRGYVPVTTLGPLEARIFELVP
jgi:glycosidase